jgi:hypothetical protein
MPQEHEQGRTRRKQGSYLRHVFSSRTKRLYAKYYPIPPPNVSSTLLYARQLFYRVLYTAHPILHSPSHMHITLYSSLETRNLCYRFPVSNFFCKDQIRMGRWSQSSLLSNAARRNETEKRLQGKGWYMAWDWELWGLLCGAHITEDKCHRYFHYRFLLFWHVANMAYFRHCHYIRNSGENGKMIKFANV